MNNWNSAIGHGIQLVETTGLKSGGHEQDVAACRDSVGHAHAEANPAPALIPPVLLHLSAAHSASLVHAHDTHSYTMRDVILGKPEAVMS